MNPDAPAARHSPDLDRFLDDLRRRMSSAAAATPRPEAAVDGLREVHATEDLPARFAVAAKAAGCQVWRVPAGLLCKAVSELLVSLGARRVVIELGADSRAEEFSAALATQGMVVCAARNDETLFAADAAVTSVSAAVAETGTIVCNSGPDTTRGSSLIPPVHVAVVRESQIVADLFDLFARWSPDTDLPANVNLITGPSKTADIEGVLVTGVHGPGEVHIVLVSEAPGVEPAPVP